MKAVLEYNKRYRSWYVWTPPSFTDRWLYFMRIGDEILGSGATREEALEDARRKLGSGERPRPSGYEYEVVDL